MNTNFGINVMTRNITDIIISLLKNKKYKNINIKKIINSKFCISSQFNTLQCKIYGYMA